MQPVRTIVAALVAATIAVTGYTAHTGVDQPAPPPPGAQPHRCAEAADTPDRSGPGRPAGADLRGGAAPVPDQRAAATMAVTPGGTARMSFCLSFHLHYSAGQERTGWTTHPT